MGARINLVFNDGTDNAVALYSHYGADGWEYDLTQAINHAKPRLGDYSYWTRMVISYLIKDEVMDETGFGIYAVNPAKHDLYDAVVVIDLVNNLVDGIEFDTFCKQSVGV